MTKEEKLVVINAIAEQLQAYPSYLVSTDLESICKPGLIVVER